MYIFKLRVFGEINSTLIKVNRKTDFSLDQVCSSSETASPIFSSQK